MFFFFIRRTKHNLMNLFLLNWMIQSIVVLNRKDEIDSHISVIHALRIVERNSMNKSKTNNIELHKMKQIHTGNSKAIDQPSSTQLTIANQRFGFFFIESTFLNADKMQPNFQTAITHNEH